MSLGLGSSTAETVAGASRTNVRRSTPSLSSEEAGFGVSTGTSPPFGVGNASTNRSR